MALQRAKVVALADDGRPYVTIPEVSAALVLGPYTATCHPAPIVGDTVIVDDLTGGRRIVIANERPSQLLADLSSTVTRDRSGVTSLHVPSEGSYEPGSPPGGVLVGTMGGSAVSYHARGVQAWAGQDPAALDINPLGGQVVIGSGNAPVSIRPARLGANVNLNTITDPGVYVQESYTQASLSLNYPETSAGLLEVHGNNLMLWQRYTRRGPDSAGGRFGTVWERAFFTTNGWSPWAAVYDPATVKYRTGSFVGAPNASGDIEIPYGVTFATPPVVVVSFGDVASAGAGGTVAVRTTGVSAVGVRVFNPNGTPQTSGNHRINFIASLN